MIDLATVIFMIAYSAPSLPSEPRDRYAADIVAAVDGSGTDQPIELAAAMVSTQAAESDWRESVETCRVTGDFGAAITAWQFHEQWFGGSTRKELCSSNALAATRAASALVKLRKRAHSWRHALRLYVGVASESAPEMRGRGKRWETIVANAKKGAAS